MEKELIDVTKKSGLYFLGGMIGNGFSLLLNLIIVRMIGAESYGRYTYVFAVVSLLPTLGVLGLNRGLVYFIPPLIDGDQRRAVKSLIGFSFASVICASGLLAMALILSGDFIAIHWLNKPELAVLLKVMAPISIILALVSIFNGAYVGLGEIKPFLISQNIVMPLLRLLALIVFGLLGYELGGVVTATYIGFIAGILFMVADFQRSGQTGRISLEFRDDYKKIIQFSLPLLLASIIVTVNGKINTFMIGYYLSVKQVGIFNIAGRVAGLSVILLSTFGTMFSPLISSLYHSHEMNKLSQLFKTTTKWMVAGNLIMLALVLLFNVEIMRIFGLEFMAGSSVLVALTLAQVINAGTGPAGNINTMTGHSSYELIMAPAILLLNVLLNYSLIPTYGILGAAITSIVTIGIANIVRLFLVYRDHKIHPYSWDYLKVIAACIMSFGVVWLLKLLFHGNWLLRMALLSTVYLVVFIAFNMLFGLSKDDRFVLDKILLKFFNIRKQRGAAE